MVAYEITTEMDLKKIIAESREVAQALNEFADNIERIDKKYAERRTKEIERKCPTCKHFISGEYGGCCGDICQHYSGWEQR